MRRNKIIENFPKRARAHSKVALRTLRMGEARVRFSLGPPNLICRRSCLGASRVGIGFRQEIPGGFEKTDSAILAPAKSLRFLNSDIVSFGGVVTKPSVQTIQKIAKSLGVPMEELLK